MLDKTALETIHPVDVKTVSGVTLQRHLALRTYSPTMLALLGHSLQVGEIALTRTTPRQTAAITTVPMALLRSVRRATPAELAWMRHGGLTVQAVHEAQLLKARRSDEAVEQFITEVGADRIWMALDRLTSPEKSAANDNTPTYSEVGASGLAQV
jgi:hypothetical protein